jgi:hypothetical protein
MVGLVPVVSQPGVVSTLADWEVEGRQYRRALEAARCIGYGRFALTGVLWHHGEEDARTTEEASEYYDRLNRVITNLRLDLQMPQLPFVLAELPRGLPREDFPARDIVADATARVARSQALCSFVPSDGLSSSDGPFAPHAYRELGFRCAASLLAVQPNIRSGGDLGQQSGDDNQNEPSVEEILAEAARRDTLKQ